MHSAIAKIMQTSVAFHPTVLLGLVAGKLSPGMLHVHVYVHSYKFHHWILEQIRTGLETTGYALYDPYIISFLILDNCEEQK